MEQQRRKLWQLPWHYDESILITGGIIFAGFIMQLFAGSFDFYLLQSPVNYLLGAFIIVLLIILSIAGKGHFFNWLSGMPTAVTLISALVIMGIIMGFIPQTNKPLDGNILSKLGFLNLAHSWSFILTYILLLLSLGALIVKRLKNFRIKDYGFYLNHAGLWILLFATGFGAADTKQYIMQVNEGEQEWRVYNEHDEIVELPFSIRLNDFVMEEYPPNLAIINQRTNEIIPKGNPAYFHIDKNSPKGIIGDWEITLNEYIHEAVRLGDTIFKEIQMPASSPAAKILVLNKKTGESISGWVSSGNSAQHHKTLDLPGMFDVVMTQPEPKRFVSDIDIITKDGSETYALLEVNKPYKHGYWIFYQYGYDSYAGKLSKYSNIQLVYDPWIIFVYIGIFLLALGSVTMLWQGRKFSSP